MTCHRTTALPFLLITACSNVADNDELYQQGGEWETRLEVVETQFPNLSSQQRAEIDTILPTVTKPERECVADRPASAYPIKGKKFSSVVGGGCIYDQVEKFGDPVRRTATCQFNGKTMEAITTGTIDAESYNLTMRMQSTSAPVTKIVVREIGYRVGVCKSQ
jgi:hypothetical protein